MRATSRPASTDARRHWCTAQCSESTGTSSAPGTERNGCTTGPAAIRLSLLARASRLPADSVAIGHRQPGEADDGVDDDVGVVDEVGESSTTVADGQRGGDLVPPGRIADGDALRAELLGLGDQRGDVGPDAEGDDLVAPGFGTHDVERLRADRAGRPGDGDPDRAHVADRRTLVQAPA